MTTTDAPGTYRYSHRRGQTYMSSRLHINGV